MYVVTTAAATAAAGAGAPFFVAVTADLHSTKFFFCREKYDSNHLDHIISQYIWNVMKLSI